MDNLPVEKSNPELLISQAIDKNVSVETMEKLLSMRRELKEEKAKEDFFRSLSVLQMELPTIKKDKEVFGNDGKLRYKFATLDSIIEQTRLLMQKYGFSYTITVNQNDISVTAICHAHHIGGYSVTTSFAVPIDSKAFMSAPQKFASALTYAKRYAFCNAFGIMTGDADNDAVPMDEPAKKPSEPKTKQNQPSPKHEMSPETKKIYDLAVKDIQKYINDGWITEKEIVDTVAVVAKKKTLLKNLDAKNIETVMKRINKLVDLRISEKPANNIDPETGFDYNPVDTTKVEEK